MPDDRPFDPRSPADLRALAVTYRDAAGVSRALDCSWMASRFDARAGEFEAEAKALEGSKPGGEEVIDG